MIGSVGAITTDAPSDVGPVAEVTFASKATVRRSCVRA